ncbi:MAG: serine/threonine protein kinase [Acidobacteria bacterium]|nr:serine/threonine protein kinase [Acidobacteriota bacterium]
MRIILLLLAALPLWGQQRTVLRGGVSKGAPVPIEEVYKDYDSEKGRRNKANARNGVCPKFPPPVIFVFQDPVDPQSCYYWTPNDPGDQFSDPPPPSPSRVPSGPVAVPAPPPQPGFPGGGPTSAPRPPPNAGQRPGWNPPDPIRFGEAYLRGVADGAVDCLDGFGNLVAGIGLLLRDPLGNAETAAGLMGVAPGQSVTLNMIAQEVEDSRHRGTITNPEQSGRIAGRRFCMYGLLPGVVKAAKGKPGAKPGATPGVTPLPPETTVPTRTVPADVTFTAEVASHPENLAGTTIATRHGPVNLGGYIGKGSFGTVFENRSVPKQVVKVSNDHAQSRPSFERQRDGARLLRESGIPTPAIHRLIEGSPHEPSFLEMDHYNKEFPGAIELRKFTTLPKDLRAEVRRATGKLFNDIAKTGHVWIDGDLRNLAFDEHGGRLRAIVLDADLIVPIEQLQTRVSQAGFAGDVLAGVLKGTRFHHMIFEPAATAGEWMNALHEIYYGEPAPVPSPPVQ